MTMLQAEVAAAGAPRVAAPWRETVDQYKHASLPKSCWQVVNSVLPFFALWSLMYWASYRSPWLALVLAVPTAGFLVRIFIIQHDCGHHAFFRSRRANDVLGALCGILTLTPYHMWRRSHARHHVTSGDLHHRGHGDVVTLTVREYLARSRWGRLQYRVYRHPLFMFLLGASYLFIIRQRFTLGLPATWRRERLSVHVTNLGILAAALAAWWTLDLSRFLLLELAVVVLAAATGTWLFFVQHQFEEAYWQPHESWDFADAALEGSSYYRLPAVLQWFTGNIGFHHIHHLSSRIPNYNLPACYAADVSLRNAPTFGLRDSLKCASLKLWDEDRQRMITFAELEIRQVA